MSPSCHRPFGENSEIQHCNTLYSSSTSLSTCRGCVRESFVNYECSIRPTQMVRSLAGTLAAKRVGGRLWLMLAALPLDRRCRVKCVYFQILLSALWTVAFTGSHKLGRQCELCTRLSKLSA